MLPSISVSHLSKNFGSVHAVRDVSFEVFPGEIFGMLGPNGAGKTTSIRIILDIFRADKGEVTILGGKLTEEKKDKIGYLPEERGLYKDLKLEVALLYIAALKGIGSQEAQRRLPTWLKRFDLYDHRHKKMQDLSRGMHQKAQLIATLLHEPDVIIVDEPFSGLDPVNTRLVKDILEEQRQAGKTIIMSAHQMNQVEAMCNRIVLINKGISVLYGPVNQIKRQFAGNAITIEAKGSPTAEKTLAESLARLPGVVEIQTPNQMAANQFHLVLSPGGDPQQVFQALARQEGLSIDRFQIAEPSLDDIFISVVQQDQKGVAADA